MERLPWWHWPDAQDHKEKEIDMAVILTEGIVRDIHLGNEIKIAQVYVRSPLILGFNMASTSKFIQWMN
jgi:hypothetical protein